jgi:hypothetical protein
MFNFRTLGKPTHYKYIINDQPYDENSEISIIKSLYYENKHGSIKITDVIIEYADTINLNEAIKIEKNKISIDNRLKERTRMQIFSKPSIVYKFYNCMKEADQVRLKNSFKIEKERETLIIFSNELKDIDLSEEKVEDLELKLRENRFDLHVKKIFTDEEGIEQSFEMEIGDDRHIDTQDYRHDLSRSIEEDEFIDFNDNSKFILKETNKVYSDKNTVKEYKRTYFNNAFRASFTRDGKLVTLGKYNPENNSYKLNIFKINPFNSNTLPNYISAVTEKLKEMKNIQNDYDIDKLYVTDYADIIKNYIIRLEESLSNTSNEEAIRRLRREIETLKLFKILFLDYKGNALDERIKIMKKNNLIKWFIESSEERFTKELPKYDRIKQIFYSMINGRVNNAIKLCGNDLNILPLLISQPHNKSSQKLLNESVTKWKNSNIWNNFPIEQKYIYEILSSSSLPVYQLPNILNYLNWKSLFICLSNYTLNYKSHISDITRAYETISKKNNNNVSPLFENYTDINYLLIKLVSLIESSNSTNEVLSMLSNSASLFSGFSSHHIQYIIITTLTNILHEVYNRNGPMEINIHPTIKYLNRLHFNLLIKCVEELLLNNNWKDAISLVEYSSISERVKDYIRRDIIFRYPDMADDTFTQYDYAYESLATYSYNMFDVEKAVEYFIKSGNYNRAFDIFLFYILYYKIIQNNVCNSMIEQLSKFSTRVREIYRWETHGKVLQAYFFYMEREEEYLRNCNIKDIEVLIKEIENMTGELGYRSITLLCKNIMIDNIRIIYNKICNLKNTSDVIYY